MSIFGPKPLDNDQSIEELGAIIYLISERIDAAIELLRSSSDIEQVVVAGVSSLRVLCDAFPGQANVFLERKCVESWRSKYFLWFERVESRLPREFRAEMRLSAEREFDDLLTHSS